MTGTFYCPVDCDVKVFMGIFDYDTGFPGQRYLQPALLIPAAFRTINIRQPHRHPLDTLFESSQGKTNAELSVAF
jgi:hypothetical protein